MNESLHQIIAHPELTASGAADLVHFAGRLIDGLTAHAGVSPIAEDWINFVDGVAVTALVDRETADSFLSGSFPHHLRFTLAEAAFPHGDQTFQRTLMRAMLESPDPRERAAGFGILATAKGFERAMVVATLAAGVGSKIR